MNIIIGVVAIVVLLLGILAAADLFFRKTNYYEGSIREYKKFLTHVPENLDYVNTGTTFAKYAFQWRKNGFNFAIAPQTMHYDFKILKNYKNHINENAVVCISLVPFIFSIADYEEDYTNIKYYSFLKKDDINNFSYLKYVRWKLFPVLRDRSAWKYIFKDINKQTEDISSCLKNIDEVSVTAENNMRNWYKQFGILNGDIQNIPISVEENFIKVRKILRDILDLCETQKWKAVLVILPVCREESIHFSESFLEKFLYNNIEQVCKGTVPVLDYFKDIRLEDYQYYINADCLNKAGSSRFQEILEEDLSKLFFKK